MNWTHNGSIFSPDSNVYGFIYKILYEHNNDVYCYYGKKQLMSITEIDSLLNGNKRSNHVEFVNRNKNGKRVTREIISKQVNYHKYNGSCKDERIDEMIMIAKEVVSLIYYESNCKTKLTYAEVELLVKSDWHKDEFCLNGNLLGKFYKQRICNEAPINK